MRRLALVLLASLSLAACEREERDSRGDPGVDGSPPQNTMPTVSPGGMATETPPSAAGAYEANAFHVSEGKRLYAAFNCSGCHANGGGDSGPALMDEAWIYGGEIEQIAATIREGRPNGMPSFRRLIPEPQVLEIAAYVRSMGRNIRQDVAPSRSDDLEIGKSESRRDSGKVIPGGGAPPGATQPQ